MLLETNAKKFSGGQSITYDLILGNASEPVGEAIFVIGFKTIEENVALAQLVGKDGRHFSLALEKGFLRLHFNQKIKKTAGHKGGTKYKLNEVLGIDKLKLNTNTHVVVRVIISTEEVFLKVPSYNLEVGANATESFIDITNKNKGTYVDHFGMPIKFIIGTLTDMDQSFVTVATAFTGCMSGAKLIYNPRAVGKKHYRKSYEIDMFKLLNDRGKEGTTKSVNPSGTFPSSLDRCGPTYKLPGIYS